MVYKQYFDITIHPTGPESEPELTKSIKKPKPKWRFPWRITMLATPKRGIQKYQPPSPETYKVYGPLDRATEFRADHLARPPIRKLYDNRRLFKDKGPKYLKTMNKTIDKSWDAIYNYYRKKLRDRELKKLKRKLAKLEAKKPKGKSLEKIETLKREHLSQMANPKKLFLPEKIPRKWKPLELLLKDVDRLAMPLEREVVPAREIGKVSSKALRYEITEAITKLYHIPDRLRRQKSEPCMVVKKSALRAKCTPRIEKLAQPSVSAQEAKKHDEDKYDPWIISKNALKYKPSARMLELAKPLERD